MAAESGPDAARSQEAWRLARRHLNASRHRLSQRAGDLYSERPKVRGLITVDEWLPAAPVPLEHIALGWTPDAPPAEVSGSEFESAVVRPLRFDDVRYSSYADALRDLEPPTLFEDRPCYRLVKGTLTGGTPHLSFASGTYFDIINTCEAVAHEFAVATQDPAARPVGLDELPFRSLIGDPCDPQRRPLIPAISVLTLRRTPEGSTSFILHRRDAAKVAHAGGLYQVMPVGVFQPSAPGAGNLSNDFDLWRSIAREYSEEFLGEAELGRHDIAIDYMSWPFFKLLDDARRAGDVRTFGLGFGVDPLSLVADLLMVAVFTSEAFDELFGDTVTVNAEGDVVKGAAGIRFEEETISRFVEHEPMQAAGAAVLQLAWDHRDAILT